MKQSGLVIPFFSGNKQPDKPWNSGQSWSYKNTGLNHKQFFIWLFFLLNNLLYNHVALISVIHLKLRRLIVNTNTLSGDRAE